MRDLDNRETRNIFEFKMDEIVADTVKRVILLGALNFSSPRSSFFINLTVEEGFINLFFRLLNSPGKSTEVF
jgi:hypothetical protein